MILCDVDPLYVILLYVVVCCSSMVCISTCFSLWMRTHSATGSVSQPQALRRSSASLWVIQAWMRPGSVWYRRPAWGSPLHRANSTTPSCSAPSPAPSPAPTGPTGPTALCTPDNTS